MAFGRGGSAMLQAMSGRPKVKVIDPSIVPAARKGLSSPWAECDRKGPFTTEYSENFFLLVRDDDDEPSKIQISQLLNRPASSLSMDSLLVEPNKEEDIDESPYAAEPVRAIIKDVHPTVPEDPVVAAIIQSADQHRTKKEKPTLKNRISEVTGHTKKMEENLGRNEQRGFLPQNGSSRHTKLSAGKIKTGKVEVMEGDIGTWVPFAEGKWYERKDKRFSEEMRRYMSGIHHISSHRPTNMHARFETTTQGKAGQDVRKSSVSRREEKKGSRAVSARAAARQSRPTSAPPSHGYKNVHDKIKRLAEKDVQTLIVGEMGSVQREDKDDGKVVVEEEEEERVKEKEPLNGGRGAVERARVNKQTVASLLSHSKKEENHETSKAQKDNKQPSESPEQDWILVSHDDVDERGGAGESAGGEGERAGGSWRPSSPAAAACMLRGGPPPGYRLFAPGVTAWKNPKNYFGLPLTALQEVPESDDLMGRGRSLLLFIARLKISR
ncbi:hypothetical protein GUITHDRAFT_161570 [Guillardia theta CCMP2712]|uniref:Uncharacterized protein n=1 Tax=Guillardia theta (strain CCMP2712) TaxID=905079 RepID=L1JU41_GUITC|nr:hypothetical protein GUITHDRAFT_161570 [Guillardia theta CCMP2712]EKX51608.1 hypothetical protein GUITHDRAFT_161570 [Guillardia theta CCMP2712]|eukprot:XP_005838588.1 hypothetical protein GUITHDRAFT_161570 [Guillardia theta CCMP2712]